MAATAGIIRGLTCQCEEDVITQPYKLAPRESN